MVTRRLMPAFVTIFVIASSAQFAWAQDRKLHIVISASPYYPKDITQCTAVTRPSPQPAKSGEQLDWKLDHDDVNPCPELDKNKVFLQFEDGVVTPPTNKGSHIKADVVAKPKNTFPRYKVMYQLDSATAIELEDPELDLNGSKQPPLKRPTVPAPARKKQ